jgi:tight adherence protein B
VTAALSSVVLAGLAGWCLGGPAPSVARLRRLPTEARSTPPALPTLRRSARWLALSGRRWNDPAGRREAARLRAAVIELCSALGAELRSGATARDALIAASRDVPAVEHLAAVAAAPHGDVAQALRASAERDGGAGLRRLAACWQVSERSGSALVTSVSRLAETLRDEEQVRREVAAQLAGPRATAVLLALLPVFGLAMGNALGADPLAVLVGTPLGQGCLVLGLLLEAAGLLWTARITRRAEPP